LQFQHQLDALCAGDDDPGSFEQPASAIIGSMIRSPAAVV